MRALVALGNRAPGTPGHAACQRYLMETLEALGRPVLTQPLRAGPLLHAADLTNVVSPAPSPRLVLGTHYDTIRKAGFVGANDGGSGTGVLLELARVLPRHLPVELAFFDGEEALGSAAEGLHGSRHFVRTRGEGVTAAVIVDMVGDRHLRLTDEQLSTPWLRDALRALAPDVPTGAALAVADDQVPFLDAGLPAALLIDYGEGGGPGDPPYWHTPEDTLDKLSADSLEAVGRLLLRASQDAGIRSGGAQ